MIRAFVFSIAIIQSAITFSQDLTDGLLLHFPLDGNATDIGPLGLDGEFSAQSGEDRFGNPNGAVYFDGVDDFIAWQNEDVLRPELPVSVSYWLKLSDMDVTQTTVFTTDFDNDNHAGVWMNCGSTGVMSINYGDAMGNTDPANRRTKAGTSVLETDVWYHITGIIRSELDMEIWINCHEDDGSYAGTGGALAYSGEPGSLGRKDASVGLDPYYFNGYLDDFRFYNRALTEEEIADLCAEQPTGVETVDQYSEFVVWPNPAINQITISGELSPLSNFRILNLTGETVRQGRLTRSLDISELANGMYVLEVLSTYKSAIRKQFVKR